MRSHFNRGISLNCRRTGSRGLASAPRPSPSVAMIMIYGWSCSLRELGVRTVVAGLPVPVVRGLKKNSCSVSAPPEARGTQTRTYEGFVDSWSVAGVEISSTCRRCRPLLLLLLRPWRSTLAHNNSGVRGFFFFHLWLFHQRLAVRNGCA